MIHVIPSCENNELVGGKEPVPSDGREQGSTWDSVKVRNGVHGLKGEGKMGGGGKHTQSIVPFCFAKAGKIIQAARSYGQLPGGKSSKGSLVVCFYQKILSFDTA